MDILIKIFLCDIMSCYKYWGTIEDIANKLSSYGDLDHEGLSALDAAAVGTWLHGAAGDICADQLGQYGLLPTDMIQVLPRLMK
jgi:NAD(P)H-hydrate repair Nnr-like enzyme with NAD(P)H-hydrate dehydratase domain